MNNALLSGVSGLEAHQTMIDVAGNNLANIDTTAYKASRVEFADLLSQTMREAAQPTAITGGTNPLQIGSGVGIASIDRNMTQGSLVHTGQPLDMAISGSGYFVLNDGQKNVFTRVGAFTVDSNYYLVDPGTGNRVQRIGSEGVADGFQDAGSSNIRIPYDVALPAKATESLSFTGNLTSDKLGDTTNLLTSGTDFQYTQGSAVASTNTLLTDLDQVSGGPLNGTIDITGVDRDGNAVVSSLTVDSSTTLDSLLQSITAAFPGSTAELTNGEIRLKDNTPGYSLTDLNLNYTGDGSIALPKNFELLSAGGTATKTVNQTVYDSQGVPHTLSGAFIRTNNPNEWDLVVTSMTGDVQMLDRRVSGLTFLPDGSFGGLKGGATPDNPSLQFVFANDPTNIRTVNVNMGTVGQFDGLSQFGGDSTAAASGQDGYASGWLSTLSVNSQGVVEGVFTNGVRKDIACLQIATFQNPEGLEALGGNYFATSANSGNVTPTRALSGGAGSVNGGALEKSNVAVASEFINLIQAQNGFQANARTITVANQMLQELTNLIR